MKNQQFSFQISCAVLGDLGAVLGRSWVVLGRSWAVPLLLGARPPRSITHFSPENPGVASQRGFPVLHGTGYRDPVFATANLSVCLSICLFVYKWSVSMLDTSSLILLYFFGRALQSVVAPKEIQRVGKKHV